MDYAPEEYTRFYIVTALFKLMHEYEYEKIGVTDIAAKAGVGRATFYRYFKRKEDVILYYFEHNTKGFLYEMRLYPRCKADYVEIVTRVLSLFKQQKEPFKLLRKARLEYLYLDYLNGCFIEKFKSDEPSSGKYQPYLYAGMLFNVSMAWLEEDCAEPVETLAQTLVEAIYFEN